MNTLKTCDDEKIAYKHYANGHDKVIVIVHGFFNSKDSCLLGKLCEDLHKRYDVFIFDLRGHGKSSGVFTWTAKEGEDLKAVLRHLKGKYEKTAIIAFSMGGSIAINVLARGEFKVDSFICVSAPSDCRKVDFNFWNLDIENDLYYALLTKEGTQGKGVRPGWPWFAKEKPIDNIQKINIPILFIHGAKDWTVGLWHSKALFEKAITDKKKLTTIKNGPHAEYLVRKNSQEFLQEVHSWLDHTI